VEKGWEGTEYTILFTEPCYEANCRFIFINTKSFQDQNNYHINAFELVLRRKPAAARLRRQESCCDSRLLEPTPNTRQTKANRKENWFAIPAATPTVHCADARPEIKLLRSLLPFLCHRRVAISTNSKRESKKMEKSIISPRSFFKEAFGFPSQRVENKNSVCDTLEEIEGEGVKRIFIHRPTERCK
jgi:hypothetical protein